MLTLIEFNHFATLVWADKKLTSPKLAGKPLQNLPYRLFFRSYFSNNDMCYSKYSIAQLNKGLFDYLKSLARISLLKYLICANPKGSAFCRKKSPLALIGWNHGCALETRMLIGSCFCQTILHKVGCHVVIVDVLSKVNYLLRLSTSITVRNNEITQR